MERLQGRRREERILEEEGQEDEGKKKGGPGGGVERKKKRRMRGRKVFNETKMTNGQLNGGRETRKPKGGSMRLSH